MTKFTFAKVLAALILCAALVFSISASEVGNTDDCISTTTLDMLSTEEIILRILDSDVGISLLASNTTTSDMYARLLGFHEYLQELEKRPDASTAMYNILFGAESDSISMMDSTCLALLLSEPIYANQLTPNQLAVMRLAFYQNDSVAMSTTSESVTPLSGPSIWDYLFALLSGYSISNTPLYTLDGHEVEALIAKSDFSDAQKQSHQAQLLSQFPGIVAVGLPTKEYNCHSYAWHNQSADNGYWINNISNYLADLNTFQLSDPTVGSICVYYDANNNPLHSAIVVEVDGKNITCLSKWGQGGLYIHDYKNVPSGYTVDGKNPRCMFYTYNHSCEYTSQDDSYHEIACIYCDNATEILLHSKTKTYNTVTHTLSCTICGWTKTEPHTYNTVTNRCTVCNYKSTGPIPVLPGI